mmetsp:Transcript_37083/g.88154  ORF Transcript_37083/g.88154 Transcript_37083/m.88154 type:complete len:178 (-) Transcript_37083:961-1494(-)
MLSAPIQRKGQIQQTKVERCIVLKDGTGWDDASRRAELMFDSSNSHLCAIYVEAEDSLAYQLHGRIASCESAVVGLRVSEENASPPQCRLQFGALRLRADEDGGRDRLLSFDILADFSASLPAFLPSDIALQHRNLEVDLVDGSAQVRTVQGRFILHTSATLPEPQSLNRLGGVNRI